MSAVRRRGRSAALYLAVLLVDGLNAGADQVQPAQVPLVLPTDLELTAHTGAPFPLRGVPGQVTLLAFGYTHCPDTCPMALSVMAQALRALGSGVDRVLPLFVSLDPARDTPEVLAQYVGYFHPAIVGVTGPEQELRRLSSSLRAHFTRRGDVAGDRYTLDHTANLYVLDAEGRVASIVPFGLPVDAVRERVAALLGDAAQSGQRGPSTR
jgi:protein SCO1/2